MSRVRIVVLLIVGLVMALSAAAPAQVRHFHPEKFPRATKPAGEGLLEWADHKKLRCPTCSGTGKMKCTTCARYPDEAETCPDCKRNEKKEAVCHACAGQGSFPDPLDHVLCPGCMGAGYLLCGMCPGHGIVKVGEAKRFSKCPGCRGDGVWPCLVCKGKRLVPTLPLKPSFREAGVAALEKALGQTDKTLTAMLAFEPKAKKTRKEVKELAKILKGGEKVHPVFKLLKKQLDKLMKSTYSASQFQGQEDREAYSMTRIKNGAEYYLKHQKHILELAHERARTNEKALIKEF